MKLRARIQICMWQVCTVVHYYVTLLENIGLKNMFEAIYVSIQTCHQCSDLERGDIEVLVFILVVMYLYEAQ